MSTTFKVALGQVRPILGDVLANVEKHLEWIESAKASSASLIVFPELGLTGYQVQDLTLEVARTIDDPEIRKIVRASESIDVVFSFVEETQEHLFFISSVYASHGEVLSVHRKVYLPTYGMFDEGRYFAAGSGFDTFPTQFGRCGMMICEDAWHVSSPYLLSLGGANLMILPASGPSRSITDQENFGSQMFWQDMLRVYARLFAANLIFVNRVGFEDGVNFFGASAVVSPEGEWVAQAPKLEEALVMAEVDMESVRRSRYITPILRDEKRDLVVREINRIQAEFRR